MTGIHGLRVEDENGFASMLIVEDKIRSTISSFVCGRSSKERRQRPRYLIFWTSLTSIWKILAKFSKKVCIGWRCSRSVTQFAQAKLDDALEEVVAKLARKVPSGTM